MWRKFYVVLYVPHNIVMNLNNVTVCCGVVGCHIGLTHYKVSTSILTDNTTVVVFGFMKHLLLQVGEYIDVSFSSFLIFPPCVPSEHLLVGSTLDCHLIPLRVVIFIFLKNMMWSRGAHNQSLERFCAKTGEV